MSKIEKPYENAASYINTPSGREKMDEFGQTLGVKILDYEMVFRDDRSECRKQILYFTTESNWSSPKPGFHAGTPVIKVRAIERLENGIVIRGSLKTWYVPMQQVLCCYYAGETSGDHNINLTRPVTEAK